MKIAALFAGVIAVLLTVAMLVTAGWTAPPIAGQQLGYRGTGMNQIVSVAEAEAKRAEQGEAPEPPYPFTPDDGETAGDFYENVQVLSDVPASEFNRIMLAMTEWVVPEDVRNNPESGGGCNYCHNPENLASDEIYTKVVARKMFQMTRDINANWSSHVADTGVTCYTCHRGKAVPEYLAFDTKPAPILRMGAGNKQGQNEVTPLNGYSSLPSHIVGRYLGADPEAIRLQNDASLGLEEAPGYQATEGTYALMMHMSQSLGVNCTYCHNSRAFAAWEQSTPQRATAWAGLSMVSQTNVDWIYPLKGVWPKNRLGPEGESPAVVCSTCHQGVNKPLYGARMAEHWPYLRVEKGQTPPPAPEETAVLQ